MDFFGIGMMEVVFILLLAFLLFGPRRLPEIARGLGKAVREFKKYTSALTHDLQEEFEKEVNVSTDASNKTPQTTGETSNNPNVTTGKTEEVQPINKNE